MRFRSRCCSLSSAVTCSFLAAARPAPAPGTPSAGGRGGGGGGGGGGGAGAKAEPETEPEAGVATGTAAVGVLVCSGLTPDAATPREDAPWAVALRAQAYFGEAVSSAKRRSMRDPCATGDTFGDTNAPERVGVVGAAGSDGDASALSSRSSVVGTIRLRRRCCDARTTFPSGPGVVAKMDTGSPSLGEGRKRKGRKRKGKGGKGRKEDC